MDITGELLAELQQKAKAAVPGCCGEMIPTGVEYGGQREMMCCEAWQECAVTVGALDILALTAHIRSLTERLEKAEKDASRWRFSRKKSLGSPEDADAAIDDYIAQEGADHE